MTELSLIHQFLEQIGQTLMLRYLLIMQRTFPHVLLQLTPEQTRNLGPIPIEWIEFCREIYHMPELGNKPPDPTPVDPNCPPHKSESELRAI